MKFGRFVFYTLMSRIGKKPIKIPEGVEVKIDSNEVTVKGPKGELSQEIRPEIKVEVKDKEVLVSLQRQTKQSKALWGTSRSLLANMVKGVVEGCQKQLQLEGVGYRAKVEGDKLILQVGFSHPVEFLKPEGIDFSVEKNIITIIGIDKEKVGQTSAKIRRIRPPEPYKGKGIRYVGEVVRRKEGKKAVTAE